MAITQEMFRFVATRPPNRVFMSRIQSRLMRDRRPSAPLLGELFGPGEFEHKLREADAFALSADFLPADDPGMVALGPVVDFLRHEITPGRPLEELVAAFGDAFPQLARLLQAVPPGDLAEETSRTLARYWDCVYAQVIRGCDRFVSTNYLVDALRVYHVLLLLWFSRKLELTTWAGGLFDDYEALIDLQAAASAGSNRQTSTTSSDGRIPGDVAPVDEGAPLPDTDHPRATPMANLADGVGVFRVPLSVGAMRPPVVGDLLRVEQDLRGYGEGELAKIETIMRGERREHTTRTLARTTQTTTTETLSEQEETTSVVMEERFQLAAQAQTTAEQSFGVQVGVSVSGKFGPVQVAATANASFDTSESSTESNTQEYAKTVTEEATKRVKNSIKQTSSITLLTETQETTLQGFNNEGGAVHINGMYRWVDALYDARLMNYGRRLMLRVSVPEPAHFFRSLLHQNRDKLMLDLVEPVHPSRINATTLEVLPSSDTSDGVISFAAISEANYAELAARYDVTGVSPPPPKQLTGGKPIVVPSTMEPKASEKAERNFVMSDSGLTIDPDYELVSLGVFAPDGKLGNHRNYADALHLGERKDDLDNLLVMVGHKEFYLNARGQGGNDPKLIDSNFNTMISVLEHDASMFNHLVQPSIPITISANFTGLLSVNVIYTAERTDEALDRWKSATYAAILQGYATKQQAYDQSLALIKAQVESETQAETFNLREDQYRSIELTELKRGCLDLLTEGTATGHTSIAVADDGTSSIVYHEADATGLTDWRSPLANGTVADFFEQAFEWDQSTYEFLPYYWAGAERWGQLAQVSSGDPIFESFLRSGSASVVVPVRPGYERPVIFFLKTGLLWGGQKMPLFTSPDMLDVYAEVELGTQLDPPLQIGPTWPVRVATSLVMLQESDELPDFPPVPPTETPELTPEPIPDETAPF